MVNSIGENQNFNMQSGLKFGQRMLLCQFFLFVVVFGSLSWAKYDDSTPGKSMPLISPEYIIFHFTQSNGVGTEDYVRKGTKENTHDGHRANILLKRNGTEIEIVPPGRLAEHAGHSKWKETTQMNHASVGIEIEGFDYVTEELGKPDEVGLSKAQEDQLIETTLRVMKQFQIPFENLLMHCQVRRGEEYNTSMYKSCGVSLLINGSFFKRLAAEIDKKKKKREDWSWAGPLKRVEKDPNLSEYQLPKYFGGNKPNATDFNLCPPFGVLQKLYPDADYKECDFDRQGNYVCNAKSTVKSPAQDRTSSQASNQKAFEVLTLKSGQTPYSLLKEKGGWVNACYIIPDRDTGDVTVMNGSDDLFESADLPPGTLIVPNYRHVGSVSSKRGIDTVCQGHFPSKDFACVYPGRSKTTVVEGSQVDPTKIPANNFVLIPQGGQ